MLPAGGNKKLQKRAKPSAGNGVRGETKENCPSVTTNLTETAHRPQRSFPLSKELYVCGVLTPIKAPLPIGGDAPKEESPVPTGMDGTVCESQPNQVHSPGSAITASQRTDGREFCGTGDDEGTTCVRTSPPVESWGSIPSASGPCTADTSTSPSTTGMSSVEQTLSSSPLIPDAPETGEEGPRFGGGRGAAHAMPSEVDEKCCLLLPETPAKDDFGSCVILPCGSPMVSADGRWVRKEVFDQVPTRF